MEDLLRLITSNPILLFLIIGAILSFLQRGKEQEAKRETRNPGTPTTRETERNEVDWREIFRQEEAQTTPNPRGQRGQQKPQQTISKEVNRTNELLEKYEIAKRNKEIAKRNELTSKDSPIYKDDITASNAVTLNFSNITREEAVKGVVWSEVLGKPRSKGSYRPSLNTRRRKQG
jgi:hypothetical protein